MKLEILIDSVTVITYLVKKLSIFPNIESNKLILNLCRYIKWLLLVLVTTSM